MKAENWDFLKADPEGAVVVALDDREDGLLFGAVELRHAEELWLNYELEFGVDDHAVSLYREAEDTPVLAYRARKRRVDVEIPPDRLLIFWNRGRRALAVDGEPLSPGEIFASAPEGRISWLLQFAGWLPWQG